jgi:hypothetical protein
LHLNQTHDAQEIGDFLASDLEVGHFEDQECTAGDLLENLRRAGGIEGEHNRQERQEDIFRQFHSCSQFISRNPRAAMGARPGYRTKALGPVNGTIRYNKEQDF